MRLMVHFTVHTMALYVCIANTIDFDVVVTDTNKQYQLNPDKNVDLFFYLDFAAFLSYNDYSPFNFQLNA